MLAMTLRTKIEGWLDQVLPVGYDKFHLVYVVVFDFVYSRTNKLERSFILLGVFSIAFQGRLPSSSQ